MKPASLNFMKELRQFKGLNIYFFLKKDYVSTLEKNKMFISKTK